MAINWAKIKDVNKRPIYHHDPVKWSELTVDQNEWGRVYYSPKGHKFPSITTLLGHTNKGKDEALAAWRDRLGEDVAAKETKRCADRGDSVHLLAEKYLKNEELNYDGHTQRSIAMFKRLKINLHEINNIRAQEIPLYSYTLGVAGRVDVIADYDGVLSAIDFKTSTKEKLKKWIEDYFVQAAAYSYMFEEMYDIKIEQLVVMIAVEEMTLPQVFTENRINFRDKLLNRIVDFRKLTNWAF